MCKWLFKRALSTSTSKIFLLACFVELFALSSKIVFLKFITLHFGDKKSLTQMLFFFCCCFFFGFAMSLSSQYEGFE